MLGRRLAILIAISPALARAADPSPEQIEYFEKKVRPIFAENCYSCHGPTKQSAGLRLDTSEGLKRGADGVPVFVPGEPAKSKLIRAVKRESDTPMPPEPKPPLKADAVAALTEWVKDGAAFPGDLGKKAGADPKTHWAFQPVKSPAIPAVKSPIRNEIDAFVATRLIEKGMSPAPEADRRTLVRRVYLDLVGIPPTREEIDAFVADPSPDAWEKLVDRVLASPLYGQRWGRYWLDVARYADTKGYVFNEDRNYPYAYTYRDYVIRSFNEDKPFDRFIIEQLAADRLPLGDDKRPLAALGFLTLGRRFLNNTQDIIDDRIDVVSRGLMGLTISCARCHDHKFDPVPTADYYSLYGVFASSTEPRELPLIGEVKRTAEVIEFEKEVEKREEDYRAEVAKRHAAHLKKFREAATAAAYIRGVFDSKGLASQQLQAFTRERELTAYVLERWQTFIMEEAKSKSRVYSPLVALADLPEKEFEEKAAELIAAWGSDDKVNPLVLKAFQDAKPKTLKAAVETFAAVIAAAPRVGPPTRDEVELLKAWTRGGPIDIPLSDFDKIRTRADRDPLAALRRKIDAFQASSPHAPPRAHVLNDAASPFQPYVFIRGVQNNRGASVPRQAPAIATPNRKPFAAGSGRLELAQAIASPENPLTARVWVNRVWAGHFGHGLVRTPSDFGTRSDPPSHPELLDWLATRFVKEGWSTKQLHRVILRSATYRQSSAVSERAYKLDPENVLLSHQNRRRLDFEAMRDSFLNVAGRLDETVGGKAVDLFKSPFPTRRSVYGLIDRTSIPGTMRAFDVANPDHHSPQRYQTTVPQQALFLMNSPFVTEQARHVAARVGSPESRQEKVIALYRLALGRNPTTEESALASEFTRADHLLSRAADAAHPFGKWPQLAQVLLLSNEFAFVD